MSPSAVQRCRAVTVVNSLLPSRVEFVLPVRRQEHGCWQNSPFVKHGVFEKEKFPAGHSVWQTIHDVREGFPGSVCYAQCFVLSLRMAAAKEDI